MMNQPVKTKRSKGTKRIHANNDKNSKLTSLEIKIKSLHCYQCSRTFLTKDAFQMHAHGDESSSSSEEEDDESESESSSEQEDDEDEFSDMGFDSESDIGINSELDSGGEDYTEPFLLANFLTIDVTEPDPDPGNNEIDPFVSVGTLSSEDPENIEIDPFLPAVILSSEDPQNHYQNEPEIDFDAIKSESTNESTSQQTKSKPKKETRSKKTKSKLKAQSKKPKVQKAKSQKPKSKPIKITPKIQKKENQSNPDDDFINHIQQIFKCPFCDKELKTKKSLYNHTRLYHNPAITTRFLCPEPGCSKGYATKSYLREHVNRTHLKEQKVTCTYEGCTRRFSDRSALKKHLDHFHLKLTPYLCDQCPQAFKTTLQLQLHQRSHGINDPNTKQILDNDFLCSLCGAAFPTTARLKRHVDAHTGEQPWKCPYPGCPAKYIQKMTMTLHYKKKHANPEPPPTSSSAPKINQYPNPGSHIPPS